jgi:hypothetical protein
MKMISRKRRALCCRATAHPGAFVVPDQHEFERLEALR